MGNPLKLAGVIPAMMTCFDEKGNLDETRQRVLTRFLLSKKVDGLYLTGSSGETFLMDAQQRNRVVDIVMDEVKEQIPVIVHVGDIGTDKSIALARHAYEAGAAAISSVPPFYFKFSPEEIYRYYQDVSNAVPIPMIVYNIALAGLVDFGMIKRLANLENVKGIKYTATTHYEIMRIKEEIGKDFLVFSGCDEMAVSGMAFGADGVIGTFYNVIPEIFTNLLKAEKAGDLKTAAQCQTWANAIILFVLQYPFFAGIKAMLTLAGYDAGFVRKPFMSLDEVRLREFRAGLIAIRERYHINGVEVMEKL